MTLHEIEETLRTLVARHAGLDEKQLLVLLRAGGWEEKTIQEAILVFRGGVSLGEQTLPQPVDEEHRIPEHVEPAPSVSKTVETSVSLVQHTEVAPREDLPHNLPLRPFETSEHIWPFARYRDVFYGEQRPLAKEMTITRVERHKVPLSVPSQPQPTPTPQPIFVVKEVPIAHHDALPQHEEKGDEKLVFIASFMLVAILLLLGYMYSNGRL